MYYFLRFIIIICSVLILGLLFQIWEQYPITKTLKYKNCEITYDYYRSGSGHGHVLFSGPSYFYSNKFWEEAAQFHLLSCLCDEYSQTKDLDIKNKVDSSVKANL